MKKLILILFFFYTFFLFGKERTCWLNIHYIECLKNMLPCECEKLAKTYFSFFININNTGKYYVTLFKFDEMEPNIYPLKKLNGNEYVLYKTFKDSTQWGNLIIENDTLSFIENGNVLKFTKSTNVKGDNQCYVVDNVSILNESFIKRNYPKLEEIVKQDSLWLDCNKWMNNINLLSVKSKTQSWMLEIKNDSLFINVISYPNDDPHPDDPFISERFKVFKWSVIP